MMMLNLYQLQLRFMPLIIAGVGLVLWLSFRTYNFSERCGDDIGGGLCFFFSVMIAAITMVLPMILAFILSIVSVRIMTKRGVLAWLLQVFILLILFASIWFGGDQGVVSGIQHGNLITNDAFNWPTASLKISLVILYGVGLLVTLAVKPQISDGIAKEQRS